MSLQTAAVTDEDDFLDIDTPAPVAIDEPEPETADAAPAADAPAAPETPTEPAPDAPADEVAPVAEADKPLTVKVGGRDVSLEGITERVDGTIVVPKDHVNEYRAMLRDALHHRTTFRDELARRESVVQETRQQAQAEIVAAHTEAKRSAALLEAYDTEIAKLIGSPEAVQRFAANYGYELEILQSRLALAQREVQTMQPEPPAPVDIRENPPQMFNELGQHAIALLNEFDVQWTETDGAELAQWIQRKGARLIVTADRDYPADGIKKGDAAVDTETIREYIADKAAAVQRAANADRAAASNAASLATRPLSSSTAAPSRSAPPVVTSRTASPSSAPAPAGPPKSKAEWEASLLRLARSNALADDFDD